MESREAYRKVLKAVRAGQLGHAESVTLWTSLNEAFVAGAVGVRWKITDPALGVEFTEDDLTLADAEVIKQRTGARAAEVDILGDATHYAAVLYAWLVNHQGRDAVDAAALVSNIPVNRAADCYSTVAVGPDPKDRPATGSKNPT